MKSHIAGFLLIMAITLCSAFSYASGGPAHPEKAPPGYVIQNDVVSCDFTVPSMTSVIADQHVGSYDIHAAYQNSHSETTAFTANVALPVKDWECSPPEKPGFKYWYSYKARDLCLGQPGGKLCHLKYNRMRNSK